MSFDSWRTILSWSVANKKMTWTTLNKSHFDWRLSDRNIKTYSKWYWNSFFWLRFLIRRILIWLLRFRRPIQWLRRVDYSDYYLGKLSIILANKVELPAKGQLDQFFHTARLARLALRICIQKSAQLGSEGRAILKARRAARLMQGSGIPAKENVMSSFFLF